jgi:lipopolysaccharide export system permease protein
MGNINVTRAESGTMELTQDQKYMILRLYNGYNYEEKLESRDDVASKPLQRTRFSEESILFDMSGFLMNRTDEALFRNNFQMFNLQQLQLSEDSLSRNLKERKEDFNEGLIKHYYHYSDIDTLKIHDSTGFAISPQTWDSLLTAMGPGMKIQMLQSALNSARNITERIRMNTGEFERKEKKILRHQIEWHRKFTLSFACLVLFFIGAPLGAIIRKGGIGLPAVFSVIFFVIFHVLSLIGEKFAKEGILPSWQAMWIASAVLLPMGVFLTIKATTDAPLLDADNWRKISNAIRSVIPQRNP